MHSEAPTSLCENNLRDWALLNDVAMTLHYIHKFLYKASFQHSRRLILPSSFLSQVISAPGCSLLNSLIKCVYIAKYPWFQLRLSCTGSPKTMLRTQSRERITFVLRVS